jgi:hypothetical protein
MVESGLGPAFSFTSLWNETATLPEVRLLALYHLRKQGIKSARRRKFDPDQKRHLIFQHHAPGTKGAYPMPTEIIVAVLMAAFGIFAATLYRADMHTREPGK